MHAKEHFSFRMSVNHEEMARCLVAEIESRLSTTQISTVTSIYFGGGI